jgi:hypothetical protein
MAEWRAEEKRRVAASRATDYWREVLCGYDTTGNFLSRAAGAGTYTEFDKMILAILDKITRSGNQADGQRLEVMVEVAGVQAAKDGEVFMARRKLRWLAEYMAEVNETNDGAEKEFWADLCEQVWQGVDVASRAGVEIEIVTAAQL